MWLLVIAKKKSKEKNCNQEQPENCKLLSAKFVKATSFCTNSDRKEGSSDQKYAPLLSTLHIQQAVHHIKYYMQVNSYKKSLAYIFAYPNKRLMKVKLWPQSLKDCLCDSDPVAALIEATES